MKNKDTKEYTGQSAESLNDALDDALLKSHQIDTDDIKVIECLSVSSQEKSSYKIKIKSTIMEGTE